MNVRIETTTLDGYGYRTGFSHMGWTCPECGQDKIRSVSDSGVMCYRCTTSFKSLTRIEVHITG